MIKFCGTTRTREKAWRDRNQFTTVDILIFDSDTASFTIHTRQLLLSLCSLRSNSHYHHYLAPVTRHEHAIDLLLLNPHMCRHIRSRSTAGRIVGQSPSQNMEHSFRNVIGDLIQLGVCGRVDMILNVIIEVRMHIFFHFYAWSLVLDYFHHVTVVVLQSG